MNHPVAVAVIPARGGSKGVPRKNLQAVGGRSLIARAVLAAVRSDEIERVVVSTDDADIANEAASAGADVVERPSGLAGDTATSESAITHVAASRPDLLPSDSITVFVQCTSPFIDPAALDAAVRRVRSGDADSVFSAVRSHGFLWTPTPDGARGINHEHRIRERRQDRPVEWLETGAFYVFRTAGFLQHRHRFFGRIEVQEIQARHAIEIDTPGDLELARQVSTTSDPLSGGAEWAAVRALVTDFDGVHTDDRATITADGRESATVNRSDGMGVSLAKQAGLAVLVISKERVPIVHRRAEKLGVECIAPCDDKLTALREWARERDLSPGEIVYVGNDVNDRECLEWVGVPVVVQDAHPSVRGLGAFVTNAPGGGGAVREVVDRLIRARVSGSSS